MLPGQQNTLFNSCLHQIVNVVSGKQGDMYKFDSRIVCTPSLAKLFEEGWYCGWGEGFRARMRVCNAASLLMTQALPLMLIRT